MTTREHTAALTASYHALNAQYFGGRLLTPRIRYGTPLDPDDLGQYDQYNRRLFIAPGQSPEEERRTLLHEMCQVAEGDTLTPGATSEFFNALCALADQGETWVLDDAVCELLGEMAEADPTRSWAFVRKGVAFILGWSPKRVDAACPHGPKTWAFYCASAREAVSDALARQLQITCAWQRGARTFRIGPRRLDPC